jgi:hypothetical protein
MVKWLFASAASNRSTVGSYPSYEQARRALEVLSEHEFPIERAAIIGPDLRLVHTIMGRPPRWRGPLTGAACGAWFGLMNAVLLALFTAGSIPALLATGMSLGAIFGGIFVYIAYMLSGGRQNFASHSTILAGRYEIIADADVAEQAKTLLVKLGWREL